MYRMVLFSKITYHPAAVSLALLLILAGDVELNPGPELQLKDLPLLLNTLCLMKSKWFLFGIQLGIEFDNLKSIESKHSLDYSRCLAEVLSFWLKENTGIGVSLESLITILKSPTISQCTLAKQLEEEFARARAREEPQESEDQQEQDDLEQDDSDQDEDEIHQNGSSEIRIISASQSKRNHIVREFKRNWGNANSCPTDDEIEDVFIIDNESLHERSKRYLRTLSDQTVEKHYHGTSITCDITRTKKLCDDRNCGICGIAKRGFDMSLSRQHTSTQFQRFGQGIYLAPKSSKCHAYTVGANGYRAMLVCDVCPGKKHTIDENDETLPSPPLGYDSVYGQSGRVLNHDEIVLFKSDAILPMAIIVYKKDGVAKIPFEDGVAKIPSEEELVSFSLCAVL